MSGFTITTSGEERDSQYPNVLPLSAPTSSLKTTFSTSGTNFRGEAFSLDETNRGTVIRNNLVIGGDLTMFWVRRIGVFENNTIIRTDPTFPTTMQFYFRETDTVIVRNNLIYDSPLPDLDDCPLCNPQPHIEWLYNAYWPPVDSGFTVPNGGQGVVIIDSGLVNGYPMFVDDSLYHLQGGSPLIDAGDPSVLDADGSRSDIGWTGGPHGITPSYPDLPPSAPESLHVDASGSIVELAWSPRPEADLARYEVYRGDVSGFWFPGLEPLKTVLPPDTTISDTLLTAGQSYFYVVTAVDTSGLESLPSPEREYIVTGVLDDEENVELIPRAPTILRVFPNPFNISANIEIRMPVGVPTSSEIVVTLINSLGQSVKVLHDGPLPTGTSTLSLSAKDSTGNSLQSGVYYVRLSNRKGQTFSTAKLVLLK